MGATPSIILSAAPSRRDLLRLATAAAVAVPAVARGAERVRILALLTNLPLNDPLMRTEGPGPGHARGAVLIRGLEKVRWARGQNLRLEIRSSAGGAGARETALNELMALNPDVIITSSSSETAAVLARTRTIPIVFATSADPVGAGFVESLARPG